MLAPVEFVFFSWPAALFHLFYGVTLSVLLVEAMFFGFQKIPFTCAYFPGKINLVFLSVMYVFGFSLYSRFMASLEEWMIQEHLAAVAFFSTAACAEQRSVKTFPSTFGSGWSGSAGSSTLPRSGAGRGRPEV